MIGFGGLFGWLMAGWFCVVMVCLFAGSVTGVENSEERLQIWLTALGTMLALAFLTGVAGLILWAVLHVRVV